MSLRWVGLPGRTPAAVVLLVLGLGIAAVAMTQGSNAVGTSGSEGISADPTPTVTPHKVCTRDVYYAAADIADNGDAGFTRELAVGGTSNPVLQMAVTASQVLRGRIYVVGVHAASDEAFAKASDLCTSAGDPNNDAYGGTPYVPTGR